MKFALLLFFAALSIAGVSAYFSIVGLVALFSAYPIAIILAGTVTEVGKAVMVSYFYRFRNIIDGFYKVIIAFILTVVMAVTSIGVFGFLSSAYLEYTGPQMEYQADADRIEERIKSERTRLSRNQSILDSLDAAFERYVELGFISRGLEERQSQTEERTIAEQNIHDIEIRIDDLRQQRNDINRKQQAIEIEVGPIQYFAKAIYGETEDALDKAVQLLIIMMIIILDPFAVTLLICANHAYANRNSDKLSDEALEGLFSKRHNNETWYTDLSEEDKIKEVERVREFLKDNVLDINTEDEIGTNTGTINTTSDPIEPVNNNENTAESLINNKNNRSWLSKIKKG